MHMLRSSGYTLYGILLKNHWKYPAVYKWVSAGVHTLAAFLVVIHQTNLDCDVLMDLKVIEGL